MSKYRKKPVVVEAVQWTGENVEEIEEFMKDAKEDYGLSEESRRIYFGGLMFAMAGDYIIKDEKGEFYPCEPEIFHKTYEEVEYEG